MQEDKTIAIKEIKERIDRNIKSLCDLDDKYLKAYSPQDCPTGTSYNDYDSIHGSKSEYRIEQYWKEKQKLLALIELDKQLIISIGLQVEDKEYLNLLNNNNQKVKYLRQVKGYTQAKTSEILGISERQVIRIENKLKKCQTSWTMSCLCHGNLLFRGL